MSKRVVRVLRILRFWAVKRRSIRKEVGTRARHETFAEALAAMPDVARDSDFARHEDEEARRVFD